MVIEPLSPKVLDKYRTELIELHKRVLVNYLMSKDVDFSTRKKFFILYDYYIDTHNIESYFFVPCKILVRAIVLDKIELVQYISGIIENPPKRRKKKKIRVLSF